MSDRGHFRSLHLRNTVGLVIVTLCVATASSACMDSRVDAESGASSDSKSSVEAAPGAPADENARPQAVDLPFPDDSRTSSKESNAALETEGSSEKDHRRACDAEKTDEGADNSKEDKVREKDAKRPLVRSIRREAEGFDLLPGAPFDSDSSPRVADAYRAIRTAQVHLKLGVAEHGNVAAFEAARRQLKSAARELAATDDKTARAAKRLVVSLEREIDDLARIAASTFFGRFPLVRAFGLEMEDNEEFEVRSYSMPGEAQRRAVRNGLTQIGKSAASGPLHVLVLVPGDSRNHRQTSPFAELVDAESHGAFVSVANLKLYPGGLRADVDPMPIWTAPDSAFDAISRQFLERTDVGDAPRSVMLVMVREFTDETGDGHWVQVQQRTYEASSLDKAEGSPEKLEADKVRLSESLTHDRSRFRRAIVFGGIALFLAAVLVHGGLSQMSGMPTEGWPRWVAIPTAGFVIGLVLPPLIMLAFQEWLPEPQTAAFSAAWWPCTAGALTLILPAGVFRLGAGGAGRYFPVLSCHGRWGIAFVPVAFGVCAAWIRPASYALGSNAMPLIVTLGIAASLLTYCFGRAVDPADQFPVALAPLALVLALVFGAGAFVGSPIVVGTVASAAALMMGLATFIARRRVATSQPTDDALQLNAGMVSCRPRTMEQLRRALDAPRYQPPAEFEQLRKTIAQSGVTQSTWVGLVGPAAAGKTAAARHLISELQASQEEVQVLVGRCAADATPYQPFREALADLGVSAGLMSSRSQGGEVNNLFERLADEFIPFWDFFSSNSDDEDEEGPRSDLLASVTNALHALTQKQRVVLFLDDIQWIDDGSAAILKHLRENFAPGGEARLVIILASRVAESLERLGLKESVVVLTPPSASEQMRILENSLGIEPASARHIVNALGVMSQEAGGMFWVLRAVRELASDNAFAATARGFSLRPAYLSRGRLPVPAAMRAKLVESLRSSGQYLPVLECAALLGEKFRVDDLAECLEMDRLKLLQVLRHLDQELQLVRDLPADQECYAFSSTFMLEIVREELGVGGGQPKTRMQPSKIARELHARIAGVLERRVPRNSQLTCAIAQHYFEAGSAYAAQCVDHCLSAAHALRRKHNLDAARHYLAMAQQSARRAHRPIDIAREWAEIDSESSTPAGPAGSERAQPLSA